MKFVGKMIGVIGLCILMAGLGYIVTKYLDKNLYLNTNLLVTFEDYKEFNLESDKELTKEEALETYPNKFKVENKSLKGVEYNVLLKEIDSNVTDKLRYILYLNDKEIKEGSISSIKDSLYSGHIGIKKTDEFKLYIYLDEKVKEPKYTYKLEVTSK